MSVVFPREKDCKDHHAQDTCLDPGDPELAEIEALVEPAVVG